MMNITHVSWVFNSVYDGVVGVAVEYIRCSVNVIQSWVYIQPYREVYNREGKCKELLLVSL